MDLLAEIDGLTLSYDSHVIFEKLHLTLERGKFHTLIGSSGVGKTQLLRLLANLNEAQASPIKNCTISFVFQKSLLFPWLTVYQNLKVTTGKSQDVISKWLDKVQLSDCGKLYPNQLSVGMQQRINLLRAFLVESELVLMDEPFAGLDHANRANLHSELLKLWQDTKCTVLFVTHDVDEALVLSQEVYLFSRKKKGIAKTIPIKYDYPRKVFDSEFQNFYIEKYKEIETFLVGDIS